MTSGKDAVLCGKGMKKGQRLLPFSDSGQPLSVSQQLPQYIRQDTAVTEVIDLDWRIDT